MVSLFEIEEEGRPVELTWAVLLNITSGGIYRSIKLYAESVPRNKSKYDIKYLRRRHTHVSYLPKYL